MAQANSSSLSPLPISLAISSSKRPVLIRSAMMIGLDVAPVPPQARCFDTSSGSIEPSHNFVPEAIRDCKGVVTINLPSGFWHRSVVRMLRAYITIVCPARAGRVRGLLRAHGLKRHHDFTHLESRGGEAVAARRARWPALLANACCRPTTGREGSLSQPGRIIGVRLHTTWPPKDAYRRHAHTSHAKALA